MKFLTYTPPERRPARPEVLVIVPRDPLWRRCLIWIALRLYAFAWLFRYADSDAPVGILDLIRWRIEGIGDWYFGLGFNGSRDEDMMILRGEIPWQEVCLEDRRRVHLRYPACFDDSVDAIVEWEDR